MFKKINFSSSPKICANYTGKGDLVIFLHGIGGNKSNWDDNLKSISKYFLCVAWDTRGYGESEDYKGKLNFKDVVNDLKKLIDFFKKPFAHVVGLSMGGQIACLFYEKYPNIVKSLILCDTHFGLGNLNKKEKLNFIKTRQQPLLKGLQPKDIANNVAQSLIGDKSNTLALKKLIQSINILHKESYLKTIKSSLETNHAKIFKKIKVPTLILVGELDTLTPPEMSKKIHNLVKGSKFAIIKQSGHLINIEKPKTFNKVVLNFLKDLT